MQGAKSNHDPEPQIAKEKLMSLGEIDRMQRLVKDSIIIFNAEKLKKLARTGMPNSRSPSRKILN